MSFEIRNKDGAKLTLLQLNNEACIVWRIPKAQRTCNIIEKEFSYPLDSKGNTPLAYSWYWIIGDAISRATPSHPEWSDVRKSLIDDQLCHLYDQRFIYIKSGIIGALYYLEPYFHLIDFWKSKGYTPIKLKKEE